MNKDENSSNPYSWINVYSVHNSEGKLERYILEDEVNARFKLLGHDKWPPTKKSMSGFVVSDNLGENPWEYDNEKDNTEKRLDAMNNHFDKTWDILNERIRRIESTLGLPVEDLVSDKSKVWPFECYICGNKPVLYDIKNRLFRCGKCNENFEGNLVIRLDDIFRRDDREYKKLWKAHERAITIMKLCVDGLHRKQHPKLRKLIDEWLKEVKG